MLLAGGGNAYRKPSVDFAMKACTTIRSGP